MARSFPPDVIVLDSDGLVHARLARGKKDPQVQQAIQGIQQQVEPLQQMVGKNDQAEMQSGLANPSGEAGGEPGGAAGGGAPEPGGGGEGATHSVEIHIRPTSFKGANKAAMATHGERGHFDRGTPKGESPTTPRTKARAKG